LEATLGKPDQVDKLGPLEQWSYEASDGKLVFAIVAGRQVARLTGQIADWLAFIAPRLIYPAPRRTKADHGQFRI
jgi:hypothetical protein